MTIATFESEVRAILPDAIPGVWITPPPKRPKIFWWQVYRDGACIAENATPEGLISDLNHRFRKEVA